MQNMGSYSGQRPPSRGQIGQQPSVHFGVGAPPQGQMGSFRAPPQTGLAPPTASNMPPRTGRRGPQAREPSLLNTHVQVDNRPVTQQGMMGMRMGSQGPGRQIQDKSYYMAEVRQKIQDISKEINMMSEEIQSMETDSSNYASISRKHEFLKKEVNQLQGGLADFNLATDKLRSSADPEDIERQAKQLKQKNEKDGGRLDKIFMERNTKEQEVGHLHAEMNELHMEAEAKLNDLDPQKKDIYHQYQQENQQLMMEIPRQEALVEEMNQQIGKLEEELSVDPNRRRVMHLMDQREKLLREKNDLEMEEVKSDTMKPESMEQLKQRAKDDDNEISYMEGQIKELQSEINRFQDRVSGFDEDMAGDESEKYIRLRAQEEEMEEFMAKFEATRDHDYQQNKQAEEMIVALLEHISRQVERQHNMPSVEKFAEMQDELDFKEKQMANSQSTLERLKEEQRQRETELEKILTLDVKINKELQELSEKSVQMKDEMATFEDIEGMREKAAAYKQSLKTSATRLQKRRDVLKQQVAQLNTMYEKRRQKMKEDETGKQLDILEQKLRTYEQNIFHLKEYIETKGRESNYQPVMNDVLSMMDELNDLAIKRQSGVAAI